MTTVTLPDRSLAVRRLKALGDETRMAILMHLASGEQCVCDLHEAVAASQSLTSFHLRTLREAGLVTDRRVGRWVHYAISPEGLAELEHFLRDIRQSAEVAPACQDTCCE